MIEVILIFICVVISVAVGFIIPTLIELRRAMSQLNSFLKAAEDSLGSTLDEIEETLKSVREMTDNINSTAQNARDFSTSLVDLAGDVKRVSDSIHNLRDRTTKNVSGIRAGVSAALEVILRTLFTRKGGTNE